MAKEEIEFEDLKASLRLDQNNLEVECAKQGSLFHFWSEKCAEAKASRDKIKDRLKLQEAKRALEIRNSGEKVTEALVTQLVASDYDLYEIRNELNVANKLVYSLEAAVDALEHKRSQLSNLVQLFIKNHYQDVRESAERSNKADNYRLKGAKSKQGEEQ